MKHLMSMYEQWIRCVKAVSVGAVFTVLAIALVSSCDGSEMVVQTTMGVPTSAYTSSPDSNESSQSNQQSQSARPTHPSCNRLLDLWSVIRAAGPDMEAAAEEAAQLLANAGQGNLAQAVLAGVYSDQPVYFRSLQAAAGIRPFLEGACGVEFG